MSNNPDAPLSPPPWFGPHAILEAVERLIVNDDSNKADAGWTLEQIKGIWHPEVVDDATLRVELHKLVQMGDLKVVRGVSGEEEHYTLSPPYLPAEWFDVMEVKQMARDEDDIDAVGGGGSTWEEIRDFLKENYQPDQPLPPEFDTVLRALLTVLYQRGELRNTNTSGGALYYTALRPPVYTNPIEPHTNVPDHLFLYYLGYKLGVGDALDDASDPAARLGPRSVLEEVDQLYNYVDFTTGGGGWTLEEIRDSLKQRYPAQSFDDTTELLQATLISLCNRGYLARLDGERYRLSITPPFFPPWFHPKAILDLEAVDNAGGSTSEHIMAYLVTKHSSHTQVPASFDKVLRTTLSVLHQRGYLTWGDSGPEHYTRRHAPATADINNDMLSYYVGYKLGRGYGLDDAGTELGNAANQPESGNAGDAANQPESGNTGDAANQLLRRFGNNKPEDDLESSEVAERPNAGQHERTDVVQAWRKEKERRHQQRLRYTIKRVCLSFIGHGILYGFSKIPGFGEETSGHHQEKTLIKWAAMDVIVPIAVLIGMLLKQFFADLELEDDTLQQTPEDKKSIKTDKMVNLAMLAASKLFYFAIKEAPSGPKNILRITAHVVAFVIDMGAAIYLWRRHTGFDQEMPESSCKVE